RQNSSEDDATLKRTVEFMVTTVGGMSWGLSISALASSASSSSLPGKDRPGNDPNKSSSRSASVVEMKMGGLVCIVVSENVLENPVFYYRRQLVRWARQPF